MTSKLCYLLAGAYFLCEEGKAQLCNRAILWNFVFGSKDEMSEDIRVESL